MRIITYKLPIYQVSPRCQQKNFHIPYVLLLIRFNLTRFFKPYILPGWVWGGHQLRFLRF